MESELDILKELIEVQLENPKDIMIAREQFLRIKEE